MAHVHSCFAYFTIAFFDVLVAVAVTVGRLLPAGECYVLPISTSRKKSSKVFIFKCCSPTDGKTNRASLSQDKTALLLQTRISKRSEFL